MFNLNTLQTKPLHITSEAKYATEKQVKFIPCLMEKSFRAESWLGIIKGSSLHVDFSIPDQFDEAFQELIRLITVIEKQLRLQPRKCILFLVLFKRY